MGIPSPNHESGQVPNILQCSAFNFHSSKVFNYSLIFLYSKSKMENDENKDKDNSNGSLMDFMRKDTTEMNNGNLFFRNG